jgi:hypothetical protein
MTAKGDRYVFPSVGDVAVEVVVNRVAKDGAWADISCRDRFTGATWTKRQRTPIPAVRVVMGEDYGPGCGRPTCPCQAPGTPCDEWMGIPETGQWCPRCGWARRYHPNSGATHQTELGETA